eukprot:3221267-Amphidinium_carterae.2
MALFVGGCGFVGGGGFWFSEGMSAITSRWNDGSNDSDVLVDILGRVEEEHTGYLSTERMLFMILSCANLSFRSWSEEDVT